MGFTKPFKYGIKKGKGEMKMRFVSEQSARTRKEAFQIVGFDWYKVVKVSGGWMFFNDANEYNTWRNQK